eukprot:scaffold1883_cov261-Pinguiococcus_pyrenoidosus.AAC.30
MAASGSAGASYPSTVRRPELLEHRAGYPRGSALAGVAAVGLLLFPFQPLRHCPRARLPETLSRAAHSPKTPGRQLPLRSAKRAPPGRCLQSSAGAPKAPPSRGAPQRTGAASPRQKNGDGRKAAPCTPWRSKNRSA